MIYKFQFNNIFSQLIPVEPTILHNCQNRLHFSEEPSRCFWHIDIDLNVISTTMMAHRFEKFWVHADASFLNDQQEACSIVRTFEKLLRVYGKVAQAYATRKRDVLMVMCRSLVDRQLSIILAHFTKRCLHKSRPTVSAVSNFYRPPPTQVSFLQECLWNRGKRQLLMNVSFEVE